MQRRLVNCNLHVGFRTGRVSGTVISRGRGGRAAWEKRQLCPLT